MHENEQNQLDSFVEEIELIKSTRILPWWIRAFSWLFLLTGGSAVILLVLSFFGVEMTLSLYGMVANGPLSLTGLLISVLFILKGIVAFGLITKKEWADLLAIVDAVTGILICIYVMIVPLIFSGRASSGLRLELVLLVPYLLYFVRQRKKSIDKI
ncbi:hypothetical protein QWZ08_10295 [Ferruginibacter paludis]|uniref:hypothetical protein n=1 Tax=Ferruginibacter paludis TaxID=1310417 RepID=UPI0025B2C154|nr:hypothetical protein [Ferruginibacter paludis]MDN3656017.1 hypothetical protein [Ferruginibacter paludis]